MLAAPTANVTVATLRGLNLVQGVTGEYATATSNLRTVYTGTAFTSPSSSTAAITRGNGFIWFFFDQAFGPLSGGTSQSFTTPRSHAFSDTPNASNASTTIASTDGFYLLGNPFAAPFALDNITVDGGTFNNTIQIYDDAIGNYQTPNRTVSTNTVAAWQGFFAQVTSGTRTFSMFANGIRPSATPTFYGKSGATASAESRVRLYLTGQASSGETLYDEAASVRFVAGATSGWDIDDASKLQPLTPVYATVAPVGFDEAGALAAKAVESRPATLDAPITVPVRFEATRAGTFSLAADLATLPATWGVALVDAATGATTDLRRATYAFTTTSAATAQDRFSLVISPTVTAADRPDGAAGFGVSSVFPNPARASAHVVVTSAATGRVRADLFDVLGRHVDTVLDADRAAGSSERLTLDTRALVPGVYVLRVTTPAGTATRRFTVAR